MFYEVVSGISPLKFVDRTFSELQANLTESVEVINPNNKIIAVNSKGNMGRTGVVIHPQFRATIPTGVKITGTKGHYALVSMKPEFHRKTGITLVNGTQLVQFKDDETEIILDVINLSESSSWIYDKDVIADIVFLTHSKIATKKKDEGAV